MTQKVKRLGSPKDGIEVRAAILTDGERMYHPTLDDGIPWDTCTIIDRLRDSLVVAEPGKEPVVTKKYEDGTGTYIVPKKDNLIDWRAIRLADELGDPHPPDALLNRILAFSRRWVDIPEADRVVGAMYVMLSYVFERFETVMHYRFRGDHGTGKSRALDVFGRLLYKVHVNDGHTTVPSVRRVAHAWRGSLALDESNYYDTGETSSWAHFLNPRIKRGGLSEVCDQANYNNIEVFVVFGPTIMATRSGYTDRAIESRCYTVMTSPTTRRLPHDIDDDFRAEVKAIRRDLMRYRLDWLRKVPTELDPEIREFLYSLDESRLAQLMTPLFKLGIDRAASHLKEATLKTQGMMVGERSRSPTGYVAMALHELYDRGAKNFTPKDLYEIVKEKYGVSTITTSAIGHELKNQGGIEAESRRNYGMLYSFDNPNTEEKALIWFQRYVPGYEAEEQTELPG